MDLFVNVLLGVVASLIAVFLFEAYLFARQRIWKRKMKKVLGLVSLECAILAPLKRVSDLDVVSFRDAYTFGHIFNICSKLNKSPYIIPYTSMKYLSKIDDVISIGGPVTNQFCKEYLEEYLTGFKLLLSNQPVDADVSFKIKGSNQYAIGFKIGDDEFIADQHNDIGVLIKIPREINQQGRTIHLIFGFRGHGAGSSAYFLWKHYAEIYKAFGRDKYCVLIESKFNQNYKAVKSSFTDVTDRAFNA